MKITILGANGTCGLQLVAQALEHGHEVTAFVRSTTWQPQCDCRLFRGDVTQPDDLKKAIQGQDLVISALGLRLKSLAPWARAEVPDLMSRSASAIAEAMKKTGVRRLMAISAGGVGDSWGILPGFFKLFIKATAMRRAYAQLEAMERVFLASGLEVCLVRPTGLTNGPKTGSTIIPTRFTGNASISRADVADFMLREAEKPAFTHRTPVISVTGVA
jgi:putative NADH-flavin reductase